METSLSENPVDSLVTVYSPTDRHDVGWIRSWIRLAQNIANSRDLLWQLFKRDFLASYKKSFLGYLWLFVSPIVGILSWSIMHYAGILRPGDVGVPYPVYILVGTGFFGFFLGAYQGAASTLSAGAGLLTQVKYPHEVLLAKQLAQHFANFSISLILILGTLFVFGVPPKLTTILLPFVLLPTIFLGVGLGLIASMLAIVASDITQAIQVGLGFLIYLSPIIYGPDAHGSVMLAKVNYLNPITHLVCSARDIVIYGRLYDPMGFAITSIGSLIIFLVAWRMFFVSEHRLIEKIL